MSAPPTGLSTIGNLPAGMRIDHFVLGRLLGKGGMGAVYLAEDQNLGRQVALKFLAPTLLESPGYLERFQREARAAARLSHPAIVGIFHLGSVNGMPYYAMEYVEGTPLDSVLARKGPLPPDTALRLLLQVVEGLEVAHRAGIIHRDLKPANLVLARDGRVKILDFGLARTSESTSLTQSGMVMGTPDYMSPEQGLGKRVDHRADIYALGVILFQMITGSLPFRGDSALAVMMSHVQTPAPRLDSVAPEAPEALCELVDRCLSKAPEDRWSDYPALASALAAGRRAVQGLGPLKVTAERAAHADTLGPAASGGRSRPSDATLAAAETRIEATPGEGSQAVGSGSLPGTAPAPVRGVTATAPLPAPHPGSPPPTSSSGAAPSTPVAVAAAGPGTADATGQPPAAVADPAPPEAIETGFPPAAVLPFVHYGTFLRHPMLATRGILARYDSTTVPLAKVIVSLACVASLAELLCGRIPNLVGMLVGWTIILGIATGPLWLLGRLVGRPAGWLRIMHLEGWLLAPLSVVAIVAAIVPPVVLLIFLFSAGLHVAAAWALVTAPKRT